MPYSPRRRSRAVANRERTAPIAAGLAVFFFLAVMFQLWVNLPLGGISPEAVLFFLLFLLCGAVWLYSSRT